MAIIILINEFHSMKYVEHDCTNNYKEIFAQKKKLIHKYI